MSLFKDIEEIVVATGNAGKRREFKSILGDRPDVVYVDYTEDEIQGKPEQIVLRKAKLAWESLKKNSKPVRCVLVEDTSLHVESLLIGPYVKDWMEKLGSRKIYEKARLLNEGEIPASAESWICIYDGKKATFVCGRVEGTLVEPRGNLGFGWDDIFVPKENNRDQLTYGEMSSVAKNDCSFRRLAIEKVKPFIRSWNVVPVVGCDWGDEGKGKIVCHLLTLMKFNYGLRWNGSCNAGHTIYTMHEGKRTKVVTHMVPSTILHGIPSVIGDACKIDPVKLEVEIQHLSQYVPNIRDLLKISANCGLITQSHIDEDKANDLVGTTKSGVGQCNRDYYHRTCLRVKDKMQHGVFLGCQVIMDTAAYWMEHDYLNILAEGAQGYELSISGTNYPYVTSTHCDVGFIASSGLPTQCIKTVVGASKFYTTYVGAMEFGNQDDPDIKRIQTVGKEFGSTTGRVRKVDWFDVYGRRKACVALGVTYLVISKCDILQEVGVFKVYDRDYYGNKILKTFESMEQMIAYIRDKFNGYVETVVFSFSPDHI